MRRWACSAQEEADTNTADSCEPGWVWERQLLGSTGGCIPPGSSPWHPVAVSHVPAARPRGDPKRCRAKAPAVSHGGWTGESCLEEEVPLLFCILRVVLLQSHGQPALHGGARGRGTAVRHPPPFRIWLFLCMPRRSWLGGDMGTHPS